MTNLLGQSFQPGQAGFGGQQGESQGGPGGQATTPIQTAIKLLSLRLPRTVGQSPLAPAPLLNAPGAQGVGANGAALLQALFSGQLGRPAQWQGEGQGGQADPMALLRMLFSGGGGIAMPSASGAGLPHIIPGEIQDPGVPRGTGGIPDATMPADSGPWVDRSGSQGPPRTGTSNWLTQENMLNDRGVGIQDPGGMAPRRAPQLLDKYFGG